MAVAACGGFLEMTTEALVRTLWPFALCTLACASKAYVGEVPKGWLCPLGKFTTVGKTNKITIGLTCRNCPVGKYQAHASPLPCKYCPQGRLSARGSTDCYLKRHFKFKMPRLPCPAGRFRPQGMGPGNALHGGCKACPAGRFGARKGLTDAFCTGACRAGRYGSGGSTSSVCTGPCPLGRWCDEGATGPFDGGVCPKGKYSNAISGAGGVASCTLFAPLEFRPSGGYKTSYGEMGACVLDKSVRVIEVLYALKVCHLFDQPSGARCSPTIVHDLLADMRVCCEGNEHVVLESAAIFCKKIMHGWLQSMKQKVESQFTQRLFFQGVEFFRDEYLLMPFFRSGIVAAKQLYKQARRYAKISDDLTVPAETMLHLCDNRIHLCTSLATIVRRIEPYYCSFFDCHKQQAKQTLSLKTRSTKAPVITGGVEEVPIGHMEPLVPEPRPAPTPVPTPQTPKPTPAPVAAPTPVPTPRVTSAPTPRVTIAPREDASNLIIPKGTTCQGDKCECRPNAGCNTCWECCNEDIAKNAAVSSGTVVTKSPSGHQMMIYSCIQCVAFACNQFLQSPTPAPTPDYTIIPGHN